MSPISSIWAAISTFTPPLPDAADQVAESINPGFVGQIRHLRFDQIADAMFVSGRSPSFNQFLGQLDHAVLLVYVT